MPPASAANGIQHSWYLRKLETTTHTFQLLFILSVPSPGFYLTSPGFLLDAHLLKKNHQGLFIKAVRSGVLLATTLDKSWAQSRHVHFSDRRTAGIASNNYVMLNQFRIGTRYACTPHSNGRVTRLRTVSASMSEDVPSLRAHVSFLRCTVSHVKTSTISFTSLLGESF